MLFSSRDPKKVEERMSLYKKRSLKDFLPIPKYSLKKLQDETFKEEVEFLEKLLKEIRGTHKEKVKKLEKAYHFMEMLREEIDNTPKAQDKGGFRSRFRKAHKLVKSITKSANDLVKISISPHFGKIEFKFSEDIDNPKLKEKEKTVYIGKKGIHLKNHTVTDWRAPISSLYYNFPKPTKDAFYKTEGQVINGQLKSKRKIDIENSQLKNVWDGEDLPSLVGSDPYLLKQLKKKASSKLKDIISTIQGDQNRIISQEPTKDIIIQGVAGSGKTSIAIHRLSWLLYNYNEMDPKRCLIVAPSKLFLKYIAELLPEIGSANVPQTTFVEWALRKLRGIIPPMESSDIKEKDKISHIKAETRNFKKIRKIAKKLKYSKGKITSKDILNEYKKSYRILDGLSRYDLAPLLYLKNLTLGIGKSEKLDYLVVDEAQDQTPAEIYVMKMYVDDGKSMFVGDLLQGILNPNGVTDWEKLIGDTFVEGKTELYKIRISYRSAKKIIEYVNKKMKEFGVSSHKLPIPVLREGIPVEDVNIKDFDEITTKIIQTVRKELDEGFKNIGIIMSSNNLEMFQDNLKEQISNLSIITSREDMYDGGPLLSTVQYLKGLEFDSIIYLYRQDYDEQSIKEFYVACTRAMHRLHVIEI